MRVTVGAATRVPGEQRREQHDDHDDHPHESTPHLATVPVGVDAERGVGVRDAVRSMSPVTDPTPYLSFPGTAREALTFYGGVFGCAVQLHTFEEFNRTDGPPDAVAHGYLTDGPV